MHDNYYNMIINPHVNVTKAERKRERERYQSKILHLLVHFQTTAMARAGPD